MSWRAKVAGAVLITAPSLLTAHTLSVTGNVRYYGSGEPVAAAVCTLTELFSQSTQSDADGNYSFAEVSGGHWIISASKSGDLNAAVSPTDATHVLEIVAGKRRADTVRLLACDVTGDGSISALDASRILQYVVGRVNRFPAASACNSDWLFLPVPSSVPNQQIVPPLLSTGSCQQGEIRFAPLTSNAEGQNFDAVLIGDCNGNWRAPTPPSSPTSATGAATASVTETPTATPTFSPSATPSPAASPTPSPTPTASQTPTVTPSATATGTRTRTPTSTTTPPHTATSTRTATNTFTVTFTHTATRIPTATVTRTFTRTTTPTLTFTPTRTSTATATFTPTSTPTCKNVHWDIENALPISVHQGGSLWLTRTVPTSTGWGVFWQQQTTPGPGTGWLYYAHVDFNGVITVTPRVVLTLNVINFRGRYFMAAWHTDHYGILLADRDTLYYYNMTLDGVTSGRRVVGPRLFVSSIYDQEADGDLDAFPGGFIATIEGECSGHSCSYVFRLAADGTPTSSVYNIADFDLTHQFYPRVAFDGTGFTILSVKDINITGGGVGTKYWRLTGSPTSGHAKVVPSKQYLWDEFPDLSWNGDHYAALWTENSARNHDLPWQIRFASFRRTQNGSTYIADRILDVWQKKSGHRWTTQLHAVGSHWIAQYVRWRANDEALAVYEWLDSASRSAAVLTPFNVNDDALGSSLHPKTGTLGIARSYADGGVHAVTFHVMNPPACQ